MIVGFTGTRAGMTESQRGALERFLRAWYVMAFVHGDCIGSDAQADAVARVLNIARVLRPCNIDRMRAHCEKHGGHVLKVYTPEHPLARNEKIVSDAHVMLATPNGPEEVRSGTWMTIRRARAAKKHIVILFPSGQIRHEGI